MGAYFKDLAKSQGLTDEDINIYLKSQETIPIKPTPTPPSPVPTPVRREEALLGRTPDVVNPFTNPQNETVTQGLNENPYSYGQGVEGHEGIDLINDNPDVTNPIGGINVSGYNPQGYGNWQAVVGASPEELLGMSPEDKQQIWQQVADYISSQPANIRDLNIPGKNISLQAHLAEPAPSDSEIATGSAKLKMGGSGGWDPHLHTAYKDTTGQMRDLIDVIKSMQYR